jgi:hypothetical protein
MNLLQALESALVGEGLAIERVTSPLVGEVAASALAPKRWVRGAASRLPVKAKLFAVPTERRTEYVSILIAKSYMASAFY